MKDIEVRSFMWGVALVCAAELFFVIMVLILADKIAGYFL